MPLAASFHPGVWVNAAGPLLEAAPREAQRLIGQGIQGDPHEPIAYFNLGLALHQRGQIPAAIRAYRQALAFAGTSTETTEVRDAAIRNLAQDLLLSGNFKKGWPLYEERLSRKDHSFFEQLAGPAWQGVWDHRPMERLVLVGEQGLGDTLMFCRLGLQLQRQLHIPVTLFCQPALIPLLQEGTKLDTVTAKVAPDTFAAGATRWCPLLSVPGRIRLNHARISHAEGYLHLDPHRVRQWKDRLGRRPGHRLVALHWQGNPKHEKSLYSRGRSMPFSSWLTLATLSNVEFVSIQKGAGSEQLKLDCGLPFVAGQPAVSATMDFRDTAAVLANCDLLMSADSGVVHLAGALGLPAWVALSHVPEWRWGLAGTATPWYKSVRLFRQPRAGDWHAVVDAMAQAWQEGQG